MCTALDTITYASLLDGLDNLIMKQKGLSFVFFLLGKFPETV